jgi:cell division protein FtsI (penicillin-binding protein 3)
VEHGTGKRARLNGYSAGGKTGSAQIYDYAARVYTHRYNGSFMGFAPVNNPAIVVVVTLNGTQSGSRGFGGVVAAPVFQKVASAALRFLSVPKDLPDAEILDDGTTPEADLADADGSEPPEEDPAAVAPLSLAATTPQGALAPPVPMEESRAMVVPTGPKVPDFQGKTMRAVLAQSSALGVRVELAGTGIARAQEPAAGSILRPGERVRVQFAR